jgi:hypothetical protein
MRLTRRTRLGELLEAHPEAAAVFEDNDIELDEVDSESPLSSVARQFEVDVEELLAELREEIDDGEGLDEDFGDYTEDEEEDDFDDDDDYDDEDDDELEDDGLEDDFDDDYGDDDDDYDDEEESEDRD